MGNILKFQPVINKRNGQINISLSKKKLPQSILDAVKDHPKSLKKMLMEFKGFDE